MQKGADIIVVLMLKFRQILVVFKFFHPAKLESDIVIWKDWACINVDSILHNHFIDESKVYRPFI